MAVAGVSCESRSSDGCRCRDGEGELVRSGDGRARRVPRGPVDVERCWSDMVEEVCCRSPLRIFAVSDSDW